MTKVVTARFGSEMNKTCKIYKPDKGLFIKTLWNSRQTGLILKNPAVKKNVRVFTDTLVRSLQFGFWNRAPAVRTTTCCHDFYAKSALVLHQFSLVFEYFMKHDNPKPFMDVWWQLCHKYNYNSVTSLTMCESYSRSCLLSCGGFIFLRTAPFLKTFFFFLF